MSIVSFGAVNMGNRKKKMENTSNNDEEKKKAIHEYNDEKILNGLYDCVICCEEFKKEDILLPCKISKNHAICPSCFEEWKINCCKQYKEVTCPVCREVLPKNGKYVHYHQNGTTFQEVNYVNDIPSGLVQIWSPEGIIKKKFYTENNKYHGLYEDYDDEGFLKQRAYYNNGSYDGLFEEYYPFEILKIRCTYKQGAINGTYQLFYNSSLLFIECDCGPIGGKINGNFTVYNEDGLIIEKYICKNARIDINFDENLNVSYSKKSGSFEPTDL